MKNLLTHINHRRITLYLSMSPREVIANENVTDDKGRISVQHGPMVFCVEGLTMEEVC